MSWKAWRSSKAKVAFWVFLATYLPAVFVAAKWMDEPLWKSAVQILGAYPFVALTVVVLLGGAVWVLLSAVTIAYTVVAVAMSLFSKDTARAWMAWFEAKENQMLGWTHTEDKTNEDTISRKEDE